MSDRKIVALGVGLLLLVLLGTATVGMALVFYLAIGLIVMTLGGVMLFMGRKRHSVRTQEAEADHRV